MVCLYPKNANVYTEDFLDNGLCALDPIICKVSEEAGGSYELYMEHPFDKHEKYQLIAEDTIIKAPIPRTVIPSITMPPRKICTVNAEGNFYQKLPVYKNKADTNKFLDYIKNNPASYTWSQYKVYTSGAYSVYDGKVYKATEDSYGIYSEPRTPTEGGWEEVGSVSQQSETQTEYTPGKIYSPALTVGATVTKLANYNDVYAQIRDLQGRVGYYEKAKLTETTTETEVIPQQTITCQLFRVYAVESEETTRVVKVYARHVSYDFCGNKLLDCKVERTNVQDAIAVMQGSLMEPDKRRIACEYSTEEITKDWSYKNPVSALLDPDDGLVPELKAKLIRNNTDYFILKNDNPRQGIAIEYGRNLLGVTWKRSTESVISRVIPRCGKKDDGYLYLEHGGTWVNGTWTQNNDIYVESADAASFPFPRIEILDAGFSVGDKYTPAGETTETARTETNCREEMLKLAQERFTKDHCDGPEITLEVEFLLLGDTEQYKQYKGLQQVNLYDRVPIKTEIYETAAQVIAYEYDCLTGRYSTIKVGSVDSFSRRVPGYNVVRESITYSKLAPDVISRIRTMNAPSGNSTGSAGGSVPGSGTYIVVEPNTKTTDGIVIKGQGNANKVWGTDADGNPGWVNSSGYTLPLAANGTRGGAQIGYTQSGKNYPVQLDNEKMYVNVPWENDDTKNTAGATDSSSKLFLIGATSQAANPQTYSQDTAFVGTDGCLYSGGTKVKTTQTAVSSIPYDGTSTELSFVAELAQDANGVISGTRRTVSLVDNNHSGLMPAADHVKVGMLGKSLRTTAISKSQTAAITITDLSKYDMFSCMIDSGFLGGPGYGIRFSATEIRFFGVSLASGGSIAYSFICMKTNGDNFNGWDTDGAYSTKWGGNVTGISNLRGIY